MEVILLYDHRIWSSVCIHLNYTASSSSSSLHTHIYNLNLIQSHASFIVKICHCFSAKCVKNSEKEEEVK